MCLHCVLTDQSRRSASENARPHHAENPFSLLSWSCSPSLGGYWASQSLKRRLVVRAPAVLLGSAGSGGAHWSQHARKGRCCSCSQAELSCEGIDYFSPLITHFLNGRIWKYRPVQQLCIFLRFTTHLLRRVCFAALAASWI